MLSWIDTHKLELLGVLIFASTWAIVRLLATISNQLADLVGRTNSLLSRLDDRVEALERTIKGLHYFTVWTVRQAQDNEMPPDVTLPDQDTA